jgi:hypothetical protein
MESFKDQIKLVFALLLIAFSTACGNDNNDNSKQKSFPTSTYVCEDRTGASLVTVKMVDHPDEKYFGDLLTTVTLVTEGLKLEIDLLLAMSFRNRRGTLEIRRALGLRDIDRPAENKNIVVLQNAEEAPHLMDLDVNREELAIYSRPLKRLLRFGIVREEPDFEDRRGVPDVGAVRPDDPVQPFFMACEKK